MFNSLVQLIIYDQWLDQSCDELSTSFRESEVVSMHGAASHQLCVRAFTCLCQDPLGIAILELVNGVTFATACLTNRASDYLRLRGV